MFYVMDEQQFIVILSFAEQEATDGEAETSSHQQLPVSAEESGAASH